MAVVIAGPVSAPVLAGGILAGGSIGGLIQEPNNKGYQLGLVLGSALIGTRPIYEAMKGSSVAVQTSNLAEKAKWAANAGESGSNTILNKTPEEISNMTRKQLKDSVPDGWDFQNHNGRIHIKDENGNYRIRIDPPDNKTNYTHIHILDENKNPLDINGNIVSPKDPSGHIPYNN